MRLCVLNFPASLRHVLKTNLFYREPIEQTALCTKCETSTVIYPGCREIRFDCQYSYSLVDLHLLEIAKCKYILPQCTDKSLSAFKLSLCPVLSSLISLKDTLQESWVSDGDAALSSKDLVSSSTASHATNCDSCESTSQVLSYGIATHLRWVQCHSKSGLMASLNCPSLPFPLNLSPSNMSHTCQTLTLRLWLI